jgi:hypothetical protein
MLACLVDEEVVSRKLSALEGDPMSEVQAALDTVMASDIEALLKEAISIEDDVETDEPAEVVADEDESLVEADAAESTEPEAAAPEASEEEAILDAFGQPVVEAELEPVAAAVQVAEAGAVAVPSTDAGRTGEGAADGEFVPEAEDESGFELDRSKGKKQRREDRQKRRQLVLDEKSGEVIAKRRRKGRRGSWDDETWEDYD